MDEVIAASDLQDDLECPVCLELVYPRIFQCSNGHLLCSRCKYTVNNTCPKCRIELGNIRNLALENLLRYIKIPCSYRSNGCNERVRYLSKRHHDKSCRFRPYQCILPCQFTGDIPTLIIHMRNIHKLDFEYTDVINKEYRLLGGGENASSYLTIYKYRGHHFCLQFETIYTVESLDYMIYLSFMGEAIEATNYHYSIEIGNETKKMTWQGVPHCTRETREKIKESGDGLMIRQTVAKNFLDRNSNSEQVLQVKGRIWIDGRSRQLYSKFAGMYYWLLQMYLRIRDQLNNFTYDLIRILRYLAANEFMVGFVIVGLITLSCLIVLDFQQSKHTH